MNNQTLRGVFDNNVLVSAALLAGVPRKAFDKLLDNGTVLVSVQVLLELADVLNREKFDKYVTHDERMRFLWVVYAMWLVGLFVLYSFCLWYGRIKQRRRGFPFNYL